MQQMQVRVTTADGRSADVAVSKVDLFRLERIEGRGIDAISGEPLGLAARLAWLAAVRTGLIDARLPDTRQALAEAVDAWLESGADFDAAGPVAGPVPFGPPPAAL